MPIQMSYGPDYGAFAMAAANAGRSIEENERRNTLADQFYQNRGQQADIRQADRGLDLSEWLNTQNVALANRSQAWQEAFGTRQQDWTEQFGGRQQDWTEYAGQQGLDLQREQMALQEELTRAGWEHDAAMAYAQAQYAQPWKSATNLYPHDYGSMPSRTQQQLTRVY